MLTQTPKKIKKDIRRRIMTSLLIRYTENRIHRQAVDAKRFMKQFMGYKG